MADTKFTPGPWAWHEDKWNGGWTGLYADGDTPVLVPQSRNDGDDGAAWFATVDDADEEGLSDADRALIAAATKLYWALDQAVTSLQDSGYGNKHVTVMAAKQALAEARGIEARVIE